ncbi:MFS transporter [Albibacillus kandeliae]|uniref:MFS transporter n=1 Tax=Albibacillus kandeliae TaxID=2174228 RepID=UPI000D695075|nr:MFS transporter [Albibacillus kandeliae]
MTFNDRQARLTILSLAIGAFAIGVSEFASMGLLPYYAADLGVSEPFAGHAVSAYAVGVVIGAPVLAVLGAFLNRKLLLVLLVAFYGVANLVSALAGSIEMLIAARFLSGLPHGAFLGVSMLFAAELSPGRSSATAVAKVLTGLTIANVIGVPAAGAIGQVFGWRWGFAIVTVVTILSGAMISRFAPSVPRNMAINPLSELSALANRAVLLTLAVSAVGFGAVFAVYAYLSAAMLDSAAGPVWSIPLALSAFGVGATIGNFLAGRLATWSHFGATLVLLAGMGVSALFYSAVIGDWVLMTLAIFALGLTAGLVIPLQMRLMDVAGNAQTMAAAMNHAAFNAANALGPFLAGLALSAGYGWASTGIVGATLAAGGIAVLAIAWLDAQRGRGALGASA